MAFEFIAKHYRESFPPAPTWTAKDIPDLSGKVYIVTGGNGGIGYVTVKELLLHGAKVYLAARPSSKSSAAIEALRKETNKTENELQFLEIEMSDLRSVKAAAEDFLKRESRLDALINNAGVFLVPLTEVTAQGYDLTFGVNTIAPHLFSTLLTPILASTASSTYKTRLVNIASLRHLYTPKTLIDYSTIKVTKERNGAREKKGGGGLYDQSKSATVMLSMALSRSLAKDNIVVISLNPGNIKSGMQRNMPTRQRNFADKVLHEPELGALTQLFAATDPKAAEYNGKYMVPWAKLGEPRKDHLDEKKQEELKAWLDAEIAAYL